MWFMKNNSVLKLMFLISFLLYEPNMFDIYSIATNSATTLSVMFPNFL